MLKMPRACICRHTWSRDSAKGKGVMKSPTEILTALAALWSRISSAIGRWQAEAAKQQSEIDAMDREIQGMETKAP
jgi:hypothetical protein